MINRLSNNSNLSLDDKKEIKKFQSNLSQFKQYIEKIEKMKIKIKKWAIESR